MWSSVVDERRIGACPNPTELQSCAHGGPTAELSFAPAFINTMADLDRLHLFWNPSIAPAPRPSDAEMAAMLANQSMQPIFDEHATIR